MITFYFKLPLWQDYKSDNEDELLAHVDKKPSSDYIFASDRKECIDVSVVFDFDTEEMAKKCINTVSDLYKDLKAQEKRAKKGIAPSVRDSMSSAHLSMTTNSEYQ